MKNDKIKGTRSWVEIDLRALRHNLREVRRLLPDTTEVMPIVKANAYGHGSISIAKTLSQEGVKWFGVASIREALTIHQAGVQGHFLILSALLPEEKEELCRRGWVATVSSYEEAVEWNRIAKKLRVRRPLRIHFKIDTGMGRLGLWWEEAQKVLLKIESLPHLDLEGIYTHFASSDTDPALTRKQLERFQTLKAFFPKKWIHCSNSGGIVHGYGASMNLVRAGILLYGYPPSSELKKRFRPVMTWKTRVTLIQEVPKGRTLSYGATYRVKRNSRIAVLSVGYADGYPRLLSNQGEVLIHQTRVPVRGRVTMDQILVDVTDLDHVRIGDEVEIMGGRHPQSIDADEIAKATGTISYEVLCGVSERVERIFLHGK